MPINDAAPMMMRVNLMKGLILELSALHDYVQSQI